MKKNFALNDKFKVGTANHPVSLNELLPTKKDTDENFKIIPYEDLVPNTANRKDSVQSNIERLADSIRTFGLIDSLRVKDEGNGKYTITSGERRWRAIGLIRQTDPTFMSDGVRCYVASETTDDIDEEGRMIVANIEREDYTPEERRIAVKRLHEIFQEKTKRGDHIPESLLDGADPSKASPTNLVAKQLDLSPRQVQKIIAINDYLSPDWLNEFDSNKININTANDISHLSSDGQIRLYEVYKEQGKVTTEEIKAFRQMEKEEAEANKTLKTKYKELEKLLATLNKTGATSASDEYHRVKAEIGDIQNQIDVKRSESVQKRSTELRLFNCINNLEKALLAVERALQHQDLREEDILRLQTMDRKINRLIGNPTENQ